MTVSVILKILINHKPEKNSRRVTVIYFGVNYRSGNGAGIGVINHISNMAMFPDIEKAFFRIGRDVSENVRFL